MMLSSIVLYYTANKPSGRYSNIEMEKAGGGLLQILHNCIQKYYFDISVPNFIVTDWGPGGNHTDGSWLGSGLWG